MNPTAKQEERGTLKDWEGPRVCSAPMEEGAVY